MGEGDLGDLQRAAVDPERAPAAAFEHDERVHDAAQRARAVLDESHHLGEADRVSRGTLDARHLRQRKSARDHERRRGREPRGGGQVPADPQVRAGSRRGRADDLAGHGADVRCPGRELDVARPAQRAADLDRTAVARRQRPHDPVSPRRGGDHDPALERGGEHEAVVVVGVLADQVDPPRRPGDRLRGPAEGALEASDAETFRESISLDMDGEYRPGGNRNMVDMPRVKPDTRKKRAAWAAAVVLGVAVATAGFSRLNPAAPTVERSTLWVDHVRRGEMVRAVRGPGSLVSEDVRWVPAMVAGRIERILVRAGEPVEPETVILELSNPDVQLEALEAQRELAAAESEYLSLEQRLRTELLDQRAVAMEARADQRDAERRAAANDELAAGDLIPRLDAERSSDAASTAAERAAVETERYELRANGIQAQLAVQRRQVERMRAVVRFQEEQVTSMQRRRRRGRDVPGGAARSRPVGRSRGTSWARSSARGASRPRSGSGRPRPRT